jgi:hypothetical protein
MSYIFVFAERYVDNARRYVIPLQDNFKRLINDEHSDKMVRVFNFQRGLFPLYPTRDRLYR